MRNRFIPAASLAVLLLASPIARAQDAGTTPQLQPTDMGQFPSILQMTGDAIGVAPNTKFQLRCGYAVNGGQIVADASTDELALLSPRAYTRYQFIDGKAVVTGLDPARPSTAAMRAVKVQVTDSGGTMEARNCMQTVGSDALQACTRAPTFLSMQQAAAAMSALQAQCSQFMAQYTTQINPSVYDPQKTAAWKANLTQSLKAIEQ